MAKAVNFGTTKPSSCLQLQLTKVRRGSELHGQCPHGAVKSFVLSRAVLWTPLAVTAPSLEEKDRELAKRDKAFRISNSR